MRVAYICADPGVPVLGSKGCSVHAQEIVGAFRRRRLEVELFATRIGRGAAPAELDPITMHQIPITGARSSEDREKACIRANQEFCSRLEERGPFDLVYERYSLWSHAGMSYSSSQGIPGILEVNAPLIREQKRYRNLVNTTAAEEVARTVFSRADSIVAVSSEVADSLKRDYSLEGKVTTVPNGVNTVRFHPRLKQKRSGRAGLTIGFCGSLKPWHGLPDLLLAFHAICRSDDSARLLIVGDGPERGSLVDLVRQLGLDGRVDFTGALPPGKVPSALASIDVAAAPYREIDFYFSPLKVFEYMAMSLPIVASDVGQISRVIRNGFNGLLYNPGDIEGLEAALLRLLDDQSLRESIGRNARRAAVARHSWDSVAQKILATCFSQAERVI